MAGNCLKRSQAPDSCSLCEATASGFHAPFGRRDKISDWILDGAGSPKTLAPASVNLSQGIRARRLLQQGQYNKLLGCLLRLDALYTEHNELLGLIENAAMRSIACYYLGDHEAAFKALHESYLLSYENNIIMPLVELGKWTRTLVRAAKAAKNRLIPAEWLELIHTKSSTYAKRLSAMANAYETAEGAERRQGANLTKREKDILSGLCQGLTREEIARACNLSINTVKSMMPNIYNKLGATNRLDAVRIAASLDLLAPA